MSLPPLVNPALGYNPTDYPNGMVYNVWKETFGKYRWYHEDGTARVIFPLDYNWQAIYDEVTSAADTEFDFWVIDDVADFTSAFLAEVGSNWLKYKTMLELMSGELTGYTISPDVFTAGFTRITDGWVKDEYGETEGVNTTGTSDTTGNMTENVSSNATQNYEAYGRTETEGTKDTATSADSKARSINYVQGIQAYDNSINNTNIGEFGNDYASTMNDTVSFSNGTEDTDTTGTTDETITSETTSTSTQDTGRDTTEANRTTGSSDRDTRGTKDNTYSETVKEERINFYDNLAFLRERADRLNLIVPFHDYFKHLFQHVTSIRGCY